MARRIVIYIYVTLMLMQLSMAQNYILSGVVKDSLTEQGIEGVNIWVPHQQTGTITDKKGAYTLVLPSPIDTIVFSCIGYHTQILCAERGQRKMNVTLNEKITQLPNFNFKAGDNPAHIILRKVHEKSDQNNPSRYDSYRCKVYSKSFFSSDIVNDSLTHADFLDTIQKVSAQDMELYALLNKQHLFLMESVKERNYKYKNKVYEKILASKISGFKDPIFHVLTSEIQSFSFYDTYFNILTTPYENPLCDVDFKHYYFSLQDTLFSAADTTYVIAFKPIEGKQFKSLAGVVYISSCNWAVKYVMASPRFDGNMVNIILEQYYDTIQGMWFPTKNKAKIVFNADMVSAYPLVGYIQTDYSDVEMNIPLNNSLFVGGELYVDTKDNSLDSSDLLLQQYRTTLVSTRDSNTYLKWDSISKDIKLDKYLYILQALASGRLPVWYFDIEVPRILSFNKHEACRLGIGIRTNDRLLKWMNVGAYVGYGFRDKEWKGGGDIEFIINRKWNSSAYIGVAYDLHEAGAGFESHFMHYFSYALRGLNKIPSQYYDNQLKYECGISSLVSRQIQLTVGVSYQQNKTCYDYNFVPLKDNTKKYSYALANLYLRMRISFARKVYESDLFTFTEHSNLPTIELAYQHGFKNVFGSDFKYNELTAKIHQEISIPYLGKFSYIVRGGIIDRPLPLSALYAVHGSYMAFGFYDRTEFATMKANEFLSDKFVSLQLSQLFHRLLKNKYCLLQPEILFNMAFGGLNHPEYHQYMEFKTMEKGYFEMGAMIHKLVCVGIVGVGVGVYWRFGAYAMERVSDNFSFRMSLTVGRQ